jgi:hypothetical protein
MDAVLFGISLHVRFTQEFFLSNLLSAFRLAALPAATASFRAEVKAFLASSLEPAPADIRARSWMGFDADFSRKLAARGWVGVTLPARYGGASLDAFSRFVLVEELLAAGAPVSAHWIADRQSGPLILKFGSEAQRQFYLPKICAAEAFFCIGMSEPNAGSDLASVGTRATRCEIDGLSGWRLNGRKIWTTNAHHCHYMIALVRSSGEPQDRQKGLSQFIVDLSLPGVTVRPIRDLTGDAHFSEVFFDNVLLADDALVGDEGNGWTQVNAELAFERSGPERVYSSIVLLEYTRSGPLRSKASSALTCVQPLPSSPTRASSASSTLSKNTSEKCASPVKSRIGRTVTPGSDRSTMNCDKPFCRSCGSPDERTRAIM